MSRSSTVFILLCPPCFCAAVSLAETMKTGRIHYLAPHSSHPLFTHAFNNEYIFSSYSSFFPTPSSFLVLSCSLLGNFSAHFHFLFVLQQRLSTNDWLILTIYLSVHLTLCWSHPLLLCCCTEKLSLEASKLFEGVYDVNPLRMRFKMISSDEHRPGLRDWGIESFWACTLNRVIGCGWCTALVVISNHWAEYWSRCRIHPMAACCRRKEAHSNESKVHFPHWRVPWVHFSRTEDDIKFLN